MRRVIPWLACAAWLSCVERPPPPPAHGVASATASASTGPPPLDVATQVCRGQVASFKAWLDQVDATGLPLSLSLLDDGAKLVEKKGEAPREPAPIVHLAADQVLVNGAPVDDLMRHVEKLLARRRNVMEGSPFLENPACYLAIDAAVTWPRVVTASTDLAKAGVEQLVFVFADRSRPVPAPGPSDIDEDLEGIKTASPGKKQQTMAELVAYVYKGCPPALEVISQIGQDVAELRQAVIDGLPAAIGKCGCKPNDAAVRALHWALFGNPHPVSAVTVALAAPAKKAVTEVSHPAGTTWSEAHPALSLPSDKQPVSLSVKPAEDPKKDGKPKRL